MNDKEINYAFLSINAEILDIKSRFVAMENIFWGWYNSVEPERKDEYRKMYEQFYRENLNQNIQALPNESVRRFVRDLLKEREK